MSVHLRFFLILFLLSACASAPVHRAPKPAKSSTVVAYDLPTHQDPRFIAEQQPSDALMQDACALLAARPHWRIALAETKQRWQVEPWFILAFLYQESRFNPNALSRSMAYGYAQVKDDSWDWYELKTGNTTGKRDRFDDAIDFIGFYANKNVERNSIVLNDVKNQYLAYHEGMGGFERGSHLAKPWLLTISDKVVDRAGLYQAQLLECPIQ